MKRIIIMTDPAMYKSDMDKFIEILPEMIDCFNKKEDYYVYNNILEVDVTYKQWDAIDDIYNCQFTDNEFIISNTEF